MAFDRISNTLSEHGFDVVEKIGQGGFGICYKVFSKQYNAFFVSKVLLLNSHLKEMQEKNFESELHALIRVTHPYIIKVFSTFRTETELYFILEYCSNGDMMYHVRKNGPMKNEELLKYATMILDALYFLEKKNLSHNDIKPSNILMDQYGRPKLADFGLSKRLSKESHMSSDFIGSPAFLAPEILQMKSYDPIKADIWSFGMTMYYLAVGDFPFKNNMEGLMTFIKSGYYEVPREVDSDIRFIIQHSLVIDPNMRMSYSDMINHLNKQKYIRKANSQKTLPPLHLRHQTIPNMLKIRSIRSLRLKGKSFSAID